MEKLLKLVRVLLIGASVLAAIYLGALYLFPEFFVTMVPGESARKPEYPAPISLESLAEDDLRVVIFRGMPVVVLRASATRMEELVSLNTQTLNGRQIDRDDNKLFVLSLQSPHLGCILEEVPAEAGGWPGGYLDTCHGLVFDYAGRALTAELYPSVNRRVDAFDDMQVIDYRIDPGSNQLHVGRKSQ